MDTKARTAAQAKKDFEKALDSLAYNQHLWTVFEDFLDYTLLMLRWQDVKEEDFNELRKRYPTDKHHKLFAEAFYALADIADNDGAGFADPFGDYFMEHFSNKFKGQFFTPEHLCDMLTQMQGINELSDRATVCDPTCGSGRTLLSAAKLNRKMLFYAADIDLNCCKMTAINFMLNSMEGEVAWMNSLSMEHWKSWHIRTVSNGIGRVPYYIITGPGETRFIERLKNSVQECDATQVDDVKEELKVGKKNQLMLF